MGRKATLLERVGVPADLDDVIVPGDVENAGHDLRHRGLVAEPVEDRLVVVHLQGIEGVVG